MPTTHAMMRRLIGHMREGRRKSGRAPPEEPASPLARAAPGGSSGVRSLNTRQGTGITELPDDVLWRILQAALCQAQRSSVAPELVALGLVSDYRSVCQKWSRVISHGCKRARLVDPAADVDAALATLRTFKNVTRVCLRGTSFYRFNFDSSPSPVFGGELLRALAEGFPLLTSFDVELCRGWEFLPSLAHFLLRRTTLRELRLKIIDKPVQVVSIQEGPADEGHSCYEWNPMTHRWQEYHALLAGLDFGRLAHLQTVTLDFSELYFPSHGPLSLPISETLAQLPGLAALHVALSDAAQVAHLPPWLAELRPFVTLRMRFRRMFSSHLLSSLAAMHSLQELELLFSPDLVLGPAVIKNLAALESLTSLTLAYGETRERDLDPGSLAKALFSPRLRKLHLICNALPRLTTPLPLLEDLLLHVSAPNSSIPRELFAFTPALRSLDLGLHSTPVWPDLGSYLTGLTFLGLNCGTERGFCDVSRMDALRELRIGNCRLLKSIAGVFFLGRATGVTLRCSCGARGGCFSCYGSYAEYARAGQACSKMTSGMARQLFRDTRRSQ